MSAKTPDYRTPGWYPDPKAPGGTRWWDGSEWSDHKNAAVATSPGATQAGDSQPEPPRENLPARTAPSQSVKAQSVRAQSLGFRGIGLGTASVVLLFLPVSLAATWIINLGAALLAIAVGIVSVVVRRRAGLKATLGMIAIVLGAIGLVGLGAVGALNALGSSEQSALPANNAPDAGGSPTPASTPASTYLDTATATQERATETQQIQQFANALLTARGSATTYPVALHFDPTGQQILDPSGKLIGTVPTGEEFTYNVSADHKSYVITLDELADGVGARFDAGNSQLVGY
jgi:hypothetical protein